MKRWKLKKDCPDLFRAFKALSEFFTKNLRHANKAKVEGEILSLRKSDVRDFMVTTLKLWRWFIEKHHHRRGILSVPDDQFAEFKERF